jgi:hypothetical protein
VGSLRQHTGHSEQSAQHGYSSGSVLAGYWLHQSNATVRLQLSDVPSNQLLCLTQCCRRDAMVSLYASYVAQPTMPLKVSSYPVISLCTA